MINSRSFRSKPPVIAVVADEVSAILVVVIPVDVPDVVEVVDLAGYRCPSELYWNYLVVGGRRRQRPSDGSSAATD